ncbi:unnamed protein product [Soboliphyme baturini]|uniref:SH3 domain-containing protein n=1 Tax=Soboliphyme baturini TaxID=241478 RepID=A0A183IQ09_9BILA|nr:unnamed protein product [Soboliphyme baturini]
MYKDASSRINVPINAQTISTPAVPSSRPPKRSSCSDESLSQTETTSEPCIPHVDSDFYDQAVNDYYNQEEPNLTILGHATAMYHFPGKSHMETVGLRLWDPRGNEGMVPIEEHDEMLVLEIDTGDGWTKVRKKIQDRDVDGFVPTSYLKLSLYPDV